MSYQESQLQQYLEQLDHLSMLRLHSAASSPETSTPKQRPMFNSCQECGTLKRPSPSSSSLQEPSPKKPNQKLQENPIILPPPPLHRCLSEPVYSEEEEIPESETGIVSATSSAEMGQIEVNPLSPENSKILTTSSSPSSLLKSVSDPTVTTTSPALPPLSRTRASLSPVFEESPKSKRLRRMKKRMKEMRKWAGEVTEEQDEKDHISEDLNTHQNSKVETEREHQEAVWIEKKGGGLVIQFKCPCGEGYQIFLCENNCYYKLT